ncbi:MULTISPECIES: sulfur carrier protein ThiS [Lentzea]|uniref:Sulfur carrier protein n=1 Tax=Lentzea jiangxiensis TaxID=641025 RepID=A0A1H0N4E7_9PSEU|nr:MULTISPECIES: sulfur carrier protein ThiS [Lentzea]WVH78483.1 sulfur carrier protein ThiS [Lentzea sp. DG1S-22]SDO87557.1 sulfur carrier protein [Lentzea jiangxiensis]
MKAQVNGTSRDLADGTSVAAVVALVGAPEKGVAVALDGAVVPKALWGSTIVPDGGVVEVLTAVQGG